MTDEKHVPDPDVPLPRKRKGGAVNRLLSVLLDITENPSLGTAERLQAAKISLEAIDRRKVPKRKTDKEKALERALNSGTKGKKT